MTLQPDDLRSAYADMTIRALALEARLRGWRPAPARTHAEVLLAELETRGRISYRELMDLYGARGYSRNGFAIAVKRPRAASARSALRTGGCSVLTASAGRLRTAIHGC